MRIRKIKYNRTGDEKGFLIRWEEPGGSGGWDKREFESQDEPADEFGNALQALAEDVESMCEIPHDIMRGILVTGVTFSYGGEKEVMGATITAQRQLVNNPCAWNVNTPHKPSDSYSDTPAPRDQLLQESTIAKLQVLMREAEGYIQGTRKQTSFLKVDHTTIEVRAYAEPAK